MISPISSQFKTINNYQKRISFKESQKQQAPIVREPVVSAIDKYNELFHAKMIADFCVDAIFGVMLTTALYVALNGGTKRRGKNPLLDQASIKFESLRSDSNIPTIDSCKSLNNKLKNYLYRAVQMSKADSSLINEAGKPIGSNRFVLYGVPGTGKSFFAKMYAKTLDAKYAELKYSDINSEWAGKSTENMKNIFDDIISAAKKSPNEKFVVTINEADTLLQPLDRISQGRGGYFITKIEQRSTFINYLDELSSRTPNVVIICTTNASPQKTGLDKAILSRFRSSIEVPLPSKDLIYEALKANLKDVKEGENFIKLHDKELKEIAAKMEEQKFSFRDMQKAIESSKDSHLDDLIKNENEQYKISYLQQALKEVDLTDGA